MHLKSGTLSAQRCIFKGNSAEGVSNSFRTVEGGAIFLGYSQNQSVAPAVSLQDCVFEGNTSAGPAGAIAVFSSRNVTINNTRFESNTAALDGGAISTSRPVTIRGTTSFLENVSNTQGGAICNTDQRITQDASVTYTMNAPADFCDATLVTTQ